MSKGIKGERINKVMRVDDNTLNVMLKDGNIIQFKAEMYGYDWCKLTSKAIYKGSINEV